MVTSPSPAACSRQRTACSAEACQNVESVVPAAVPAVSALARTMATWGSWQPRIGDQRVAEGMPGARPCGSNTATGPLRLRSCRVTARLSGRVLVVSTAPGASRIIGIARWRPLPDRGGPRTMTESSMEEKHRMPRDVPSWNPTPVIVDGAHPGRRMWARADNCRSPATRRTIRAGAQPSGMSGTRGVATRRRYAKAASATPTRTTAMVQDQYSQGGAIGWPQARAGSPGVRSARSGAADETAGTPRPVRTEDRAAPDHSAPQTTRTPGMAPAKTRSSYLSGVPWCTMSSDAPFQSTRMRRVTIGAAQLNMAGLDISLNDSWIDPAPRAPERSRFSRSTGM